MRSVIFNTNGVIVPQKESVQKYLDGHIIGESEIKDGNKFFITMAIEPKGKDEIATLTLLKSHSDGQFNWRFTIKDYTRWIKSSLKKYFQ